MSRRILETCWPVIFKTAIPKFNKEHKPMLGTCNKLSFTRIEPCQEPYSKCLELAKPVTKPKRRFFRFYKTSAATKEKPTNSKKIEPKKESSWKSIFGINKKKSCPPSCTCLTTCQKQMITRRRSTPETILIRTQIIKTKEIEPLEPQPRPTPPYKVPRAGLSKIMIENTEKELCKCINALYQNHDYKIDMFKINPIPYQEMRPSIKMKKPFTCKDGLDVKDVVYPSETVINPSRMQDS